MKKGILLAFCFLSTTIGMAQLPNVVQVGLPKVLTKGLISEKDVASINSSNEWGKNTSVNKFWVAWSDRKDNVTYKGPSSSSGQETLLDFNETVRIAEIKNDFAHVYVEKQGGVPYPQIKQATDKGWIPMKHLLLWSSCPANERGILNKALIVVNLSEKDVDKKNLFRVYLNPNKKTNKGYATSSINFYFVMKEDRETGLVLLATGASLQGKTDKVLYGWFNKDSYVKWNQRSCLEPNWDHGDISYFKSEGKDIRVYLKPSLSSGNELTKPFKFGSIENKDGRDIDRYRMPSGSLRYPILDSENKENSTTYYCNVFAANGNLTDAAQYNNEMVDRQNSAVRDAESVNLIIAIDGTRSMEPFYNPVKDAIKRGYSSFEDKDQKVKVGIVIYRDYKDGQYLTEVLPLTKHNDPRIAEFLDKGGDGVYGIKSAPGDDVPEALFEGLKVATDKQKMKFDVNESNLLLVVGDCGNRLNDKQSPTQAEITQRLINNKFQVVAFQVRRMNQQPYNWFQDQMGKLIVNNIKGQIQSQIQNKIGTDVKVGWKPSPRGYELNSELAKKYYIGSLLYPKAGNDMKVSDLSEFIQSTLEKFSEAVNSQRELVLSGDMRGNETDSLEASFNEAFIESRLGKEYVKFMKKTNSIMSAPGYTLQKDNKGYDYWKTVIYISSEELNELLERLQGVYKAAKNSDYTNREPYVNAFKGVIKAMIPEISNERMNAMSQEEIMAQVGGLNARTETVQKHTLQQIVNPKLVDDQEYARIIQNFAEKYENLNRIKTSRYPFTLLVNGLNYYWIPTEMIP